MKKVDYDKIENKLTGMMAALDQPEQDRFSSIKLRARGEFFRRDDRRRRIIAALKGLFSRAGIAVAAALILMAASVVYTALAPVTVSSANNFVRHVALWVNNTLHLGMEFPVPLDDVSTVDLAANGETSFATIQEAARALGMPLIGLADESGAELVGVTVKVDEQRIDTVSITYKLADESIMLVLIPVQSLQMISAQNNEHSVETSIGTMLLWTGETRIRGRMTTNNWDLILSTELSKESLEIMLNHLVIN